jgi:hypothetical protein
MEVGKSKRVTVWPGFCQRIAVLLLCGAVGGVGGEDGIWARDDGAQCNSQNSGGGPCDAAEKIARDVLI